MEEILKLVLTSYGPYAGVVAFILWRDWSNAKQQRIDEQEREKRLGDRLDKITDTHNVMVSTVIRENSVAMSQMASSNQQVTQVLQNILSRGK